MSLQLYYISQISSNLISPTRSIAQSSWSCQIQTLFSNRITAQIPFIAGHHRRKANNKTILIFRRCFSCRRIQPNRNALGVVVPTCFPPNTFQVSPAKGSFRGIRKNFFFDFAGACRFSNSFAVFFVVFGRSTIVWGRFCARSPKKGPQESRKNKARK